MVHVVNSMKFIYVYRYLGDGRFHLESIMISNPHIPAYRQADFMTIIFTDIYFNSYFTLVSYLCHCCSCSSCLVRAVVLFLFLLVGMIHTARYSRESIMTLHRCPVIVRLPLRLQQKHRHLVWYWEL